MKPLEALIHLGSLPVGGVLPAFEPDFGKDMGAFLSELSGLAVYPRSVVVLRGAVAFLGKEGLDKKLCVLSNAAVSSEFYRKVEGRTRNVDVGGEAFCLKVADLASANADLVRKHIPFTAPGMVGSKTSVGLGDRLGLATPGHLRAVEGTGVAPYLAQQSIREMTRTERTAAQVMDCATWGVLEFGWREGFGSDADHLKLPEDIDRTAAAGFTMFTVDPGDHVDSATDTDDGATLARKFEALPWAEMETSAADCKKDYVGRSMPADCAAGPFSEKDLIHAAAKYGRAVAHTARMYRHLAKVMGGRPFELEASVDETATPTTEYEHYYIASELRRLGVRWVSLAPRFIGEFEKGVDYIGDLAAFRQSFSRHAAIARRFGPYKISVHSGSDKFSVYPIVAELTQGLAHVKTAGTSYLEALRAVATIEPALFREILAFGRQRYPEDRRTYHVSASVDKVPAPGGLKDADLPGVLDTFDGREVLHVTFGSVLTSKNELNAPRFRDRLLLALRRDEETHYEVLRRHIGKHLAPFAKK